MEASLDVILNTLQNGVTALNNLRTSINTVFPRTTASSTGATTGSVTFSSSQPAGFMIVQTSSGATVKIAYYNQ